MKIRIITVKNIQCLKDFGSLSNLSSLSIVPGIIALTLLVTLFLATCSYKQQPEFHIEDLGFRPNILWITCEDIGPALGCYGDSVANTPNLDKLAQEGIMFTNAFSVAGVCAPSRHALITGMYPTSTGGHHMRTIDNLIEDIPDYGVVLPPEVRCFSEILRTAGYYCTNNQKTDYQFYAPVTAWDECDFDAHWRKRPAGKPFFSVINLMTTHESRIWTQSWEPLLVDEKKVVIPPYFPEHPTVRRDIARKYSNIAEMDRQVEIILEQLKADGLLDSTIIFFYSDNGGMLPREKRELYDTGLRIPLIIRFPGKALAGTITDELVSFVDFAPTVLSLAGVKIPSYMQGQAFLGLWKSKEPRKYIYGARDRMDTEYDMVRAVRDNRFKYIRNYHPELPFVQNIEYRKQIPMMQVLYEYDEKGLYNDVQKLWWRKTKPVEELYDTREDPWELNDLAEKSEYADKLEEMRNALADWQNTYGDKGFIPEKIMVKEMWGGEIQPVTQPVEFNLDGNLLTINCKTNGSSIAWRYKGKGDPDQWFLYTGPVILSEPVTIEALANRIGYADSEIRYFKNEKETSEIK
jgi:N-sulfoglucosamine sulfohydrolase